MDDRRKVPLVQSLGAATLGAVALGALVLGILTVARLAIARTARSTFDDMRIRDFSIQNLDRLKLPHKEDEYNPWEVA